jgi:CHAT domain-containing protein
MEEALLEVESLRINIKSQHLRASFFATVRNYHESNIDVLMKLHKEKPSEGFDALALQASERSRARSLLELISEARAEIREGVAPALLERERSLQQLLAVKTERQARLRGGRSAPEELEFGEKEITGLTAEYEQVQAEIRQGSPRYAALTQPRPLSLKQIQSTVLDDQTLMLEYSLGEERSYLWSVTPTSINTFELPKRAEVESAAKKVYGLLTARNRVVPNETPDQRQRRIDQADTEFASASAALSGMLLGPVASQLGTRRLLIVTEGLLQYLPFGALPVPNSRTSVGGPANARPGAASVPLAANSEVVTLPSASVLSVLRSETAGRKPAPKVIAVLADPVFRREDPRLAASGTPLPADGERAAATDDVLRSASESGVQNFARLRFTRSEADEITRLAPDDRELKALDFDASRSAALDPRLAQYRIVHFATHGLVNNQHPELSGIVLSLVDRQGKPQNGFLRLYEIFNLKLGADLVVLSACQTAFGKDIRGEGLIGLTRGFMYAGTTRVVASLWLVDDRATSELMKRFYQGMLGEGLRPAAALRSAQLSLAKDKRWQSPYYWAAFTFQGEWK